VASPCLLSAKKYFAAPINMCLLSIIIATKNSALYIGQTLSAVANSIQPYGQEAEIIVVNDGGDAAVKAQVLAFKEAFDALTYVSLPKPCGQQLAIRAGLQMARGQYLVTFDDDLQYRAEDIPRLLAHILQNSHLKIVCGYSESKKHRGLYSFISKLTVLLLEYVFFRRYRDAHYFTSLKIFERSVLLLPDGMRNIYFFWDFNPAEIGFIEVPHFKRTAGLTGYNLPAYLKFFRHIILKMFLLSCLFFFPVWTLTAYFYLPMTTFIAGSILLLSMAICSAVYLSHLKHQTTDIGEVIT
jgi:glycosyltransferase involved in cell wall biosynthesis